MRGPCFQSAWCGLGAIQLTYTVKSQRCQPISSEAVVYLHRSAGAFPAFLLEAYRCVFPALGTHTGTYICTATALLPEQTEAQFLTID
eukprot:502392-Pelagomonas_calceolata.AAC.2